MKKKILSLIFCVGMFAMGPARAMEKDPDEDSSWHIKIARGISDAWGSITHAHKCSVCAKNKWFIDPGNRLINGAFSSLSDDVIRRMVLAELSPKEIFLLPTISKKMCNVLNFPAFWNAMEKQNKVHVSKELCPKQNVLENYKYYTQHSSGLFKDYGEGIKYSVKNPIFLSFMEKPCESTWKFPWGGKNEPKFYSFSIDSKQFELYLLNETPKCVKEAKKDLDGETLFTSVSSYNCFQAGSLAYPTCFVRELKSSAK